MKFLTHIAAWAVVCILPALIFISEGNHRFEEALYRSLTSLPFLMFLFYSCYYWLIDKLWFKKQYLFFVLMVAVLILCASYSFFRTLPFTRVNTRCLLSTLLCILIFCRIYCQ